MTKHLRQLAKNIDNIYTKGKVPQHQKAQRTYDILMDFVDKHPHLTDEVARMMTDYQYFNKLLGS